MVSGQPHIFRDRRVALKCKSGLTVKYAVSASMLTSTAYIGRFGRLYTTVCKQHINGYCPQNNSIVNTLYNLGKIDLLRISYQQGVNYPTTHHHTDLVH